MSVTSTGALQQGRICSVLELYKQTEAIPHSSGKPTDYFCNDFIMWALKQNQSHLAQINLLHELEQPDQDFW